MIDKKRLKVPLSVLFYTILLTGLILTVQNWFFGADTTPMGISETHDTTMIFKSDLAEIKEKGVLRAITTYSATSYFLYKGRPMGFEYELLQHLTDDLGVELELVVAENIDEVFEMLNRGDGDLVAHGLTITKKRKEEVAFTHHHLTTKQVLVQRKPQDWRQLGANRIEKLLIRDPYELGGRTVHVRKNSAYAERLENLSEEIGEEIGIVPVPGEIATEEIIKKVANEEYDYTVADDNIAAINQTYYHNIDTKTPISLPQRIAWAVRKSSPELLKWVNKWLKQVKQEPTYNIVYNKYFKNRKGFVRRIKSKFYSKEGGMISIYDEDIQEHADHLDWDWRLLASMVYQESRFNPKATSWVGAKGLMQVMPATGKQFGEHQLFDPESNLNAGTAFLNYLHRMWKTIPDSVQRIKFILASYNVGPGHVLDAQRLAKALDKDPLIWDENVEDCIRLKSQKKYYTRPEVRHGYCRGEEPYQYVRKIFARYGHYTKFIPEDSEKKENIAQKS